MHTMFGCACLLTDKFVVVADVFFRKTMAKAAARLFPNQCANLPASTTGKDTPSMIND